MLVLQHRIQEISEDHTSGSLELLSHICKAFETFFQETKKSVIDPENWEHSLRQYSELFQPFPVVQHFFSFMSSTGTHDLKRLESRFHEYQSHWAHVDQKIAEHAYKSIDPKWEKFLVHSHSLTVKTFFKWLADRSEIVTIFQTESRPLYEGREQAKWLDRMGHQIILITEAQSANAVFDVDVIISGADRVYKDGFINKVGTLNLAILAQYYKTPLWILYDGRKWIDASTPPHEKQNHHNLKEIWEQPEGNIQIRNYTFEWIPHTLVSQFISESRIHHSQTPE